MDMLKLGHHFLTGFYPEEITNNYWRPVTIEITPSASVRPTTTTTKHSNNFDFPTNREPWNGSTFQKSPERWAL